MRTIAAIIVWNDDRFIRSVIESALEGCDEVHVAVGLRPWNGEDVPMDKTLDYVRQYGSDIVRHEGVWSSEHDQRNFILNALNDSYFSGDNYLAVIDADEVYEPSQLLKFKDLICGNDIANTHQRVYFKHGNWLVQPFNHFAQTFLRLTRELRFTNHRHVSYGNSAYSNTDLPPEEIVVHHFNTVGTYEEIKQKHQYFGHAKDILSNWLDDTWAKCTIDSTNLHQVHPSLHGRLVRVSSESLPSTALRYRESLLLDE